MKIFDFVESNEICLEADIVVEEVNDVTGEVTERWKSWSNERLPYEVGKQDICYMTIVNGYSERHNSPVLIIEY